MKQKDYYILKKIGDLKRSAWRGLKGINSQSLFASKYAAKSKEIIMKGMKAVGQEAGETEEMARSFFRMLEAKLNLNNRSEPPTEEEVRAAIEQLKDVGRFSVFAAVSILPGGAVSLLGLELLARKFGLKHFTLIPSSFRKKPNGNPDRGPLSGDPL